MDRDKVASLVTMANRLPVMKAWLESRDIQARQNGPLFTDWKDFSGSEPPFDDMKFEWRIKPQPREWWLVVNPHGGVLVFETEAGMNCSSSVLKGAEKIYVQEVLK